MKEQNNRNVWFIIAGVFSAISAAGMYLATIIMIFGAVAAATVKPDQPIETEAPEPGTTFAAAVGVLIFLIFLFAIIAIISTICSKKCFDFSKLSKEGLLESKSKVILIIVLLFLFGGLLTGVLALLGYILTTEEKSEVVAPSGSVEEKLKKLETMYEQGLISEEEHKKAREEVLKQL